MSRERNLDCSLVDNDLHLEWTVGKDLVLNFRMKNNSIALLTLREALKKNVFLGIISKPVDPPLLLGTFRNKKVNLGQI